MDLTHAGQQRTARVIWLPGVFFALLLGIIGMHGLSLHGADGASDHGLHAATIQPAEPHTPAHAAEAADSAGGLEFPAPAQNSDVMALCLAMLGGAGLALLFVLFVRSRAGCWRTARSRWHLPGANNAQAQVGPPGLLFSILRC